MPKRQSVLLDLGSVRPATPEELLAYERAERVLPPHLDGLARALQFQPRNLRAFKNHVIRSLRASEDHDRLGWKHTEKTFFQYKRHHTCDFCNKPRSADMADCQNRWYDYIRVENRCGAAFSRTVTLPLRSSRMHPVVFTPKIWQHNGWTRQRRRGQQPIRFQGRPSEPVLTSVLIRMCTLCFLGWELVRDKGKTVVYYPGALAAYHHPKALRMSMRVYKKAENFLPLLGNLRLFSRKVEVEGPMDQYVKRIKK